MQRASAAHSQAVRGDCIATDTMAVCCATGACIVQEHQPAVRPRCSAHVPETQTASLSNPLVAYSFSCRATICSHAPVPAEDGFGHALTAAAAAWLDERGRAGEHPMLTAAARTAGLMRSRCVAPASCCAPASPRSTLPANTIRRTPRGSLCRRAHHYRIIRPLMLLSNVVLSSGSIPRAHWVWNVARCQLAHLHTRP